MRCLGPIVLPDRVSGDRAGVFEALADPTRLWMVHQLARSGSLTPTLLARELPISRQAVSRHLGVLQQRGLVTVRRDGREHRYALAVDRLREAAEWIAGIEREWDIRLAELGDFLALDDQQQRSTGSGNGIPDTDGGPR